MALSSAHCEAAQESIAARVYPVKAVRCIVAAPPGGAADRLGRRIALKLSEAWAQVVVIDNRPGANGIIGTEMVARAAPDGYTVGLVAAAMAINPGLYSRVPYDPVRDFAAVTQLVAVPGVLVVHPSLTVSSVNDLVAHARAKPGTITFASAGKGSASHLTMELFQIVSASRFAHLPQKGGAGALSELLNGHVHAMFGTAIATVPHVRAGRLKGLAVTGAARSRAAPDLPTVAESGFAGFEVTGWYGVVAPAKTPAAIVSKLNGEIVRALLALERGQGSIEDAADAVGSTPREFATHIAAESRKWSDLIRQTGIKLP
jgi:tripartite-type tricarboxylate transporter receptor subunit TctC